jgi:hypothetical protein
MKVVIHQALKYRSCREPSDNVFDDFEFGSGAKKKAHDPHGKLGLRTGQSQRREICM